MNLPDPGLGEKGMAVHGVDAEPRVELRQILTSSEEEGT